MSKDSIPLSPEADQEADDRSENNGELELDASGLYCPEPVMLLHNKIRDMQSGQTLRLTATDPSTTRDVPKFCLYLDHELLESGQEGEIYHYRIRKKVS